MSTAGHVARSFLPFAAGYFLSYLFRTVNAVVGPQIAIELQLDAAALGALTSAYFAAFVLSQIPLGVALDRFGPRRVQSVLLCSAVAGGFVFGAASDLLELTAGRALIGLGVSGCLMAAFSANALAWPRHKLPMVNGLLLACGGLGATVATLPAQWMMNAAGWRSLFFALAGVSALVIVALLLAAPDRRAPAPGVDWRDQLRGVAQVFRSRIFWRVAPVSVVAQGTFLAYQGLWAGPWLRDVGGYPPGDVATILFATSAMMIVGFVSTGTLFSVLVRRGLAPEAVIAVGQAVFIVLQVPLAAGAGSLGAAIWPLFGLVGTGGALTFTWLTQRFPAHLSGRVNTSLNLLVFLGAFVVQAGVGLVLDRAGNAAGSGYAFAFGIMVTVQVVALAWFLLVRTPVDSERLG